MKEAAEKDLWINAIEASKILDGFPSDKLEEIHWVNTRHDIGLFENRLRLLISDLLTGEQNSLFNNKIAD